MGSRRCPGQDTRYWTPEDLFEIPCAHCGAPLEFFKDDLRRRCPTCGRHTVNPRNDMACAAWCRWAAECLAQLGRDPQGSEEKAWG
ncbi:MAG: hypothetical protein GX774_20010 [Armatimonadetes bacterium]|jgi:hypothetical protein|nr:hypothetical protein [Armatimonadota bacterium]